MFFKLKVFYCPYLVLLISFFSFLEASNSLDPYKFRFSHPSYSNYGTIGLIQMPNARFLEEGSLGFSWTHNEPYLRGSLLGYPFNWLEVSYQYTDINNKLYSPVKEFSGSQSYKDKSFDMKLLLLNESNTFPQIAVGARDLAGTGIFSSEYIVASKFIKNFDLSIGIGWGNLSNDRYANPFEIISDRFKNRSLKLQDEGGEFNTSAFFRGDSDLFYGVEFFLPNQNGKRIKLEYDSTNYFREGFNDTGFGKKKKQSSKYNIGYVHPVSNRFTIKLSYTKGNTLSFGFSYAANLGRKSPIIPKKDNYKPVANSEIVKSITSTSDLRTYRASLRYLADRDIFLQKAHIDNETLFVHYSQSKFHSPIQAAGRVMRTLDEIAPDHIKEFHVTETNGGILMNSVNLNRKIFSDHLDNNLYSIPQKFMRIDRSEYDGDYSYLPESKFPKAFWTLSPSIRSQLGGPDGFYFGQLSLALNAEVLFDKDISLVTTLGAGLLDNFDELNLNSDSILPHVRTDQVLYLKNSTNLHLTRMQLNRFYNPTGDIYLKASAGYLESMFGGIGGEFLWRPFRSNFGIGAELWQVWQREIDMKLGFRDYDTVTGHINLFFDDPRTGLFGFIKGGKFLAGDSGLNFNIARKFKSGMRMGVFFSITDISKEEFGEGSFDKGFFFFFPVDIFFQNYNRNETGFGLRPITRDGAAVLNHSHPLWGITDHAGMSTIRRDWDDLYD